MSIENPTPDRDLDYPYIARYAGKVEDPNEVVLRADFARMQHVLDTMDRTETGPEFYRLADQANEIDLRWLDADGAEERSAWRYLSQAHEDWQQSPEVMAQMYGQMQLDQDRGYQFLTTAQQWRSQQQARELTGHGEWTAEQLPGREPDRTPGLDGSWANAAEIDTGAAYPVSTEFARARTAAFSTDMPGAPTPGMHRWPDLTNTHQEAEPMTDPTRETSSSSALADYQPSNAVDSSVANAERDGATR